MKNRNYWLMLCNPDKWYGDKAIQNREVNNILSHIKEYPWTIGKNTKSFKNIKVGDFGIIKVGNDNRSVENRTLRNRVVDKLEPGIYAILEVVEKKGSVFYIDKNFNTRVNFKVVNNLFKNGKIIDKDKTKKLLENYFNSYSSCEITEEVYSKVLNEI